MAHYRFMSQEDVAVALAGDIIRTASIRAGKQRAAALCKDAEIDHLKSLIARYAEHIEIQRGMDLLDCQYLHSSSISLADATEIRAYRAQRKG